MAQRFLVAQRIDLMLSQGLRIYIHVRKPDDSVKWQFLSKHAQFWKDSCNLWCVSPLGDGMEFYCAFWGCYDLDRSLLECWEGGASTIAAGSWSRDGERWCFPGISAPPSISILLPTHWDDKSLLDSFPDGSLVSAPTTGGSVADRKRLVLPQTSQMPFKLQIVDTSGAYLMERSSQEVCWQIFQPWKT